jgi:hypothetical protein
MLDVIWENVKNRCIIKPNIKTNYSKVSGENGSWLSCLDLESIPKFLKDGFKTSKRLIEKYKPQILELIKEDKYDKAFNFIDDMVHIDMDDKPKSQTDMDDDNYFYGNSEEESDSISGYQKIENEQIAEFQRSYKRFKLMAYDNSKLLK